MPDPIYGLPRGVIPRGTPEGGAYVQTPDGRPLATIEAVPDWTGSDSLTVSSVTVLLQEGRRLSNNYCLIAVETAAVRFWLDGTAPTSTTGLVAEVGDIIILETVDELQDVQFIRRDGADAVLSCNFGRRP